MYIMALSEDMHVTHVPSVNAAAPRNFASEPSVIFGNNSTAGVQAEVTVQVDALLLFYLIQLISLSFPLDYVLLSP